MSELEGAMAESVSRFANDIIAPKVREMDEKEQMDPAIVEQLFEQGLMGIEIPEKYGGAGMNFTSAIVGVEELARVDPSVSVMVDVHNTLVNTAILKYGSQELKDKWLPRLATNTVGEKDPLLDICTLLTIQVHSVFLSQFRDPMRLPWLQKLPKPTPDTRSMVAKCGSQTQWKPASSLSSPIWTIAKDIRESQHLYLRKE